MIDQHIAREKLEHLMGDPTGEIAEIEFKLDLLDLEIHGEQRLQYEETKARLDALGIDTSRFRPPPPLHRSEQRSTRHITAKDDIGELFTAVNESPLDRLARLHLADEEPAPQAAPLR